MTPPTHQFVCFGMVYAKILDIAPDKMSLLSDLIGGVMTPPYTGESYFAYLRTTAPICSNCASMSETSLNWVRQRSRFCSG